MVRRLGLEGGQAWGANGEREICWELDRTPEVLHILVEKELSTRGTPKVIWELRI